MCIVAGYYINTVAFPDRNKDRLKSTYASLNKFLHQYSYTESAAHIPFTPPLPLSNQQPSSSYIIDYVVRIQGEARGIFPHNRYLFSHFISDNHTYQICGNVRFSISLEFTSVENCSLRKVIDCPKLGHNLDYVFAYCV